MTLWEVHSSIPSTNLSVVTGRKSIRVVSVIMTENERKDLHSDMAAGNANSNKYQSVTLFCRRTTQCQRHSGFA